MTPRVRLIQYGDELVCAQAALVCTSSEDIHTIFTKDTQLDKILERVYGMGHESILEHLTFTFAISGVSRALSHQLVRHRIASYSQRSQRYIDEVELEVIIPPSIQANALALAEVSDLFEQITVCYEQLRTIGIPAEDARYILPNATATQLVMTMNARSLLHFFQERLCSTAQWEIRELAEQILVEAKKVAPVIMQFAGPKCDNVGYCKEKRASWAACQRQPHRKD